eukprot:6457767-Amphidinium_carterae.2
MKQAPALNRKEVDVDDKSNRSLMDLTVCGKNCKASLPECSTQAPISGTDVHDIGGAVTRCSYMGSRHNPGLTDSD